MKTKMILILYTSLSLSAVAASLEVKITNLSSAKGTVKYLLFLGSHGYPDKADKSVRKGSFAAKNDSLKLSDLAPGEYAMTFFHDENDNDKLDTRLGLPKEAFGFSQNPRIFFGPPAFNRSSFKHLHLLIKFSEIKKQ